MSQVTHWTPRKASAAIGAFLIVAGTGTHTADGSVVQANADTSKALGVSGSRAVVADETVEIAITGIADVKYGGNVAVGDLLTSDSDGKAVATTTAGKRVVGIAMAAGVDDDIGEVLLAPGSV